MPGRRPPEEAIPEMGNILRSAMSGGDDEFPELLMPVPEEHALRQFEIQALRQITDNLKQLNENVRDLSKEVKNVDTRLIRIESNKVEPEVEKLKSDVQKLMTEKHRRDGALGLTQWIFRNWPAVLGYFGLLFTVLKSTGKI